MTNPDMTRDFIHWYKTGGPEKINLLRNNIIAEDPIAPVKNWRPNKMTTPKDHNNPAKPSAITELRRNMGTYDDRAFHNQPPRAMKDRTVFDTETHNLAATTYKTLYKVACELDDRLISLKRTLELLSEGIDARFNKLEAAQPAPAVPFKLETPPLAPKPATCQWCSERARTMYNGGYPVCAAAKHLKEYNAMTGPSKACPESAFGEGCTYMSGTNRCFWCDGKAPGMTKARNDLSHHDPGTNWRDPNEYTWNKGMTLKEEAAALLQLIADEQETLQGLGDDAWMAAVSDKVVRFIEKLAADDEGPR